MTSDAELRNGIAAALRQVLGERLAGVNAAWGLDHYGEPALHVVVDLQPGIEPLGGELTTAAVHATRQTLLAAGDDHFPVMTFVYPDDEPAIDEDVVRTPEAS